MPPGPKKGHRQQGRAKRPLVMPVIKLFGLDQSCREPSQRDDSADLSRCYFQSRSAMNVLKYVLDRHTAGGRSGRLVIPKPRRITSPCRQDEAPLAGVVLILGRREAVIWPPRGRKGAGPFPKSDSPAPAGSFSRAAGNISSYQIPIRPEPARQPDPPAAGRERDTLLLLLPDFTQPPGSESFPDPME